eukprot:3129258-Karenia_brevis.AAC.1
MRTTQGVAGEDDADQRTGACDEWFIDDGQAFVLPSRADAWLRAVDAALADIGAVRGVGEECKSVARLLCPEAEVRHHEGWDTDYIHGSCRVLSGCSPVKVLGAMIGPLGCADAALRRVVDKVQAAREAVEELDDPAAELTLTR